MDFDELQFSPTISWGVTGGPSFSTTVLASSDGYESRNRNWSQPRCEYDCSQNIHTQAELDVLLAFFYARMGPARGFRFKDWTDYKHDMRLSVAAGNAGATSCYPATGDGARTTFQLLKAYTSGGITQRRAITKPVQGTIQIYVNAGLQTEDPTPPPVAGQYSIDYATGIVTFATAPPNGQTVKWRGEFDVPARFAGDDMPVRIEDFQHTTWGSIRIIEVRDPAIYVLQDASTTAFHDVLFPMVKDFGITGGPRFRTQVFQSTGGHEARESGWSRSRNAYQAGHLLQDHAEFAALLDFFRARWGRAFGFRFHDETDYKANMTGVDPVPMATSESGVLIYQITKPYTDVGNETPREIKKPRTGTVQIWVNGVLKAEGPDYSIDYATGIVTFTAQPTGVITWLGEFDVPVRFDMDAMSAILQTFGRHNWSPIKLVELRE